MTGVLADRTAFIEETRKAIGPIEVIVFAAPNRDEAHALCYGSLRESDVGENFTVCEHPPELSAMEHWRATHERAAKAAGEFVIIIEDDVLVNRHLLYNVLTWRYKHDKRTAFGAGWLYAPGGYSRRDTWYTGTWEWFGTCGVLYETARLPALIERAWQRMQKDKVPWDLAISWASHFEGRRLRVHQPALVEHLNDLPSRLGNPRGGHRTSGGTFSRDWRRPEKHLHGIIDEWGRKVI